MNNTDNIFDDPLFVCLLIDESASMQNTQEAIFSLQNTLLDELRKTKKCKVGALFVGQFLFNEKLKVLNDFECLSDNGQDQVLLLKDNKNYSPENHSTFFDSVQHLLKAVVPKKANECKQKSILAKFFIAAITDGEDNASSVTSDECKKLLAELEADGIIQNSILTILTNTTDNDEKKKFEKLKSDLGFKILLLSNGNSRDFRQGLSY